MKISNSHKFIFLSNPKCGSSSLRRTLYPYSQIDAHSLYKNAPSGNKEIIKQNFINILHISAKELKHSINQSNLPDIWDEYYTFSTVRNPWRKMVSWYFFLQPDKNMLTILDARNAYDIDSAYTPHFNDFVDHLANNARETLLPSYDFFFKDWDTGAELMDDVFKLEDLDATLPPRLEEKTGLKLETPLPNYMPDFKLEAQSKHVKFKGDPYDLYNESSKQFVSEFYKSDIEKFDYSFGE
jgi:hypothetical protein